MFIYLIVIFGFLSGFFFFLSFMPSPEKKEATATSYIKRRLEISTREKLSISYQERTKKLEKSFRERITNLIFNNLVASMSKLVGKFTPQTIVQNAKKLVAAAGMEDKSINMILAGKGFGAIALFALPILWFISSGRNPGLITRTILFSGSGIFLGFFLPEIILQNKISKRHEEILKMLPYTLDLLKVSVEAGLGLDEAFLKVVEKTKGSLAEEINLTLHEVRMGKHHSEALLDMSKRINLSDLTSFITVLIQAEKMGVSIGSVLDIQADQMRNKHRQRIQEKALATPTKMLLPLVLFIFPCIFIVLLGPAVLQLMAAFRSMR
jgi:tight adherence protein C